MNDKEKIHELGCDEYHAHESPKCCNSDCWCRQPTIENKLRENILKPKMVEDQYTKGFNEGIKNALKVIKEWEKPCMFGYTTWYKTNTNLRVLCIKGYLIWQEWREPDGKGIWCTVSPTNLKNMWQHIRSRKSKCPKCGAKQLIDITGWKW